MTNEEIEDRLFSLPGKVRDLSLAIIEIERKLLEKPRLDDWQDWVFSKQQLASERTALIAEDRNLRAILYARTGECSFYRSVIRGEKAKSSLGSGLEPPGEEDHEA